MVLLGLPLHKLLFISFNKEFNFNEQAFALKTFFIVIFTYFNTFKKWLKVSRNDLVEIYLRKPMVLWGPILHQLLFVNFNKVNFNKQPFAFKALLNICFNISQYS